MTSTSSEPLVLRGPETLTAAPAAGVGDLRRGRWTRLGDGSVHGDPVTEATLAGLVERVERVARSQGYAAGWAEGRRRVTESARADEAARASALDTEREQLLAEQQQSLAALTAAVDAARAELAAAQEDLAARAVALGLAVAEAVLGRELATATDPGADALARVLAEVPATVPVTVRLHPADLAALDPAVPVLAGRDVTLVADPSLARGDAVAETATGSVDATVAAALARVREVLLP